MVGKTLAHYEILEKIGTGGMGEIYRARDTKLKREVAIKVLPHDVAADPARLERFQREAETLAGLSHPHIVHLYSSEEADGVRFLTMELVDGKGLDHLLTPDGLPLPKLFEIGIALADALSAAHEKGITHRDIKPANVMISARGLVKVLDFGLARLAADPAPPQNGTTETPPVSREGAVLGTVPYMSPEQLRGQEVDSRSDIFSLGILLYELATGRRPFGGATYSDVGSSILRDTPPLLTKLKPDLPRTLARIVAHCLEKEPERRFQSAKDVRNELEGLRDEVRIAGATLLSGSIHGIPAPEPASVHAAVRSNSIAVLPFVNMSDEASNEYFSDGVSEELLNLLTKIPKLRVTSRSSAFSFKGQNLGISEIAKRLNVAHVLEGSVRRAGSRARITAQLVEATSDTHLWSQTYDRTLDDIFAIQDEIAADVVAQLKVTLLGAARTTRETTPEAYALFLRARHLRRLYTVEHFEKGLALLQEALALDPEYAAAWEELGSTYVNQAQLALRPIDEGFRLAREATNKALALDPEFAPAHAGLGWIAAQHDGDLATAARHFERALELEPANPDIIGCAAMLVQVLGRLDEEIAIREFRVRRDPVNPSAHSALGTACFYAGRLDEAIASFRSELMLTPNAWGTQSRLGGALLLRGDHQAALEAVEQEPSEVYRLLGLVEVHHALGHPTESDAALREVIEKYERGWACNIASALAYRGEADRAFAFLDKAVEYCDSGLPEIAVDNGFANLHADPRWLPFLHRLGKAPEQLAAIKFKVTLPE